MFMFLHVAWKQPNQTNLVFVFDLHGACFLEEMCVAGGTVFLLCTSPDDVSLKGGCVMCEGKFVFFEFWHVGTKDVLHVLFQTNLKPNDSDVKHYSHVKHSFFWMFAEHWRTRNTTVMSETVDVKELH